MSAPAKTAKLWPQEPMTWRRTSEQKLDPQTERIIFFTINTFLGKTKTCVNDLLSHLNSLDVIEATGIWFEC